MISKNRKKLEFIETYKAVIRKKQLTALDVLVSCCVFLLELRKYFKKNVVNEKFKLVEGLL